MQALKLKGKIDESGRLIVYDSVDLLPGEVEIIVLSSTDVVTVPQVPVAPASNPIERLPATASFEEFKAWFLADLPPASPDFDADAARWEALKEKHNL